VGQCSAHLAMRQSQSAQSAVCVVMVEPSLEALRPTAMAVHLSEITALGSESTTAAVVE
jgi:hypothetical protein